VAETLLRLRDVVVRYGATTALDIQLLEVKNGEVLAIVGSNGAGKSTLLRVMGLLQVVDRGVVEFPELAAQCSDRLSLRRRIAAVFQEPLLVDDNVFGNVALGLRLRGVAKAEIEGRVLPWLTRLGIGHLAERSARTLSGGEAQRASLARALVLAPDLLLLDEPFAALDPSSREALLRDFHRTVKGLGVTVVLVTHDRHEAFALAQRVAVLDGGRLAQLGSRDEVFHHPISERVAAIVGFENRLIGVVEASNGAFSTVAVGGQSVGISANYAVGSKVILCIRASNVLVAAGGSNHSRQLRFGGKIREVFCAQPDSQVVVDCDGFTLVGKAQLTGCPTTGLSEGCAVTATLEPGALHVILADNSR
jgi:tungstate transport system ATP-binding protein